MIVISTSDKSLYRPTDKRKALIEPLEYKEDKKIQDLVIAIDTSASVKEKVIQRLINETYDILLSKESFFHHFNLYLIQCDSQIQDVTIIHQYE